MGPFLLQTLKYSLAEGLLGRPGFREGRESGRDLSACAAAVQHVV